MPTVMQPRPYIHLERDAEGRIIRVLHRREGDPMPEVGESDMGLFALSLATYLDRLPAYANQVEIGRTTGERNFLPFIPWLARTETIVDVWRRESDGGDWYQHTAGSARSRAISPLREP